MADRKLHVYENDAIRVTYDRERCIHAALCVHGLPDVFDTTERPWVKVANGSPDEIANVVRRCPTGSLHYERKDGAPNEAPPAENTALVSRHGPLYIRAEMVLVTNDGSAELHETRLALCRCGASAQKPFCDGAHTRIQFQDRGEAPAEAPPTSMPLQGLLRIEPTRDGPLKFRGPLALVDSTGKRAAHGQEFALCRCGASAQKPFCDGSHTRVGFRSEK